jgi:hypothetical protein
VEEEHVSTTDVASICSHPDSDVVDQNVQAHIEVVHKSEETFYGFYPDGFKEFDLDNAPSSWIPYSLEVQSDEEKSLQSTSERTLNIWDTFKQLD